MSRLPVRCDYCHTRVAEIRVGEDAVCHDCLLDLLATRRRPHRGVRRVYDERPSRWGSAPPGYPRDWSHEEG